MLGYIITSFVFALFLVLFYYTFKQNPKEITNRSLALMTLLLGFWSVVNFLENEVKTLSIARLLLDFDFVLAAFSAFYFFKFCLSFTASSFVKYFKFGLIATWLVSISVILGFVITNIRYLDGTLVFDFSPLFWIYALLLCLFILLGCVEVFKKYLKSSGLYRVQLLYVLVGLTISGIIALVSNLVFPLFGITDLNLLRLGIYGMVFVIGFTSYAILRYRLMDIRVIIRRSAVFTALVLLITAIYSVIAFALSTIFTQLLGFQSVVVNGIVMALLVAVGFEPLKIWLSYVTNSFLFKAEYKPQEVLAEFADKLASTLDLEIVSDFITKRLSEVFKSQFVSLFLLDDKNQKYKSQAVSGKPVKETKEIDQALFERIHQYLAQTGQEKNIFVKEEIKKINEQVKNPVLQLYYEELEKYGVNLVVPLYNQDKLIGILFLGDKKSGDVYGSEDIRVLEIIAAQSAVAMQNARLFEEQKHFTEHLKREVEKATKELKVANAQLKKLDKAKSEFISIASHQLRTPLTVIKGYLSMISQGDFGPVPQAVVGPLDKVSKSTMRIIGLVEDLLNISRIESGRMKYEFERVDLPELVNEVFEELEQHGKNKGLQFTYEKPKEKYPPLILDRSKIREVVMNLMDNAIKYTEKGFVRVNITKDENYLVYSVTDSGRGLETDDMSMLFQKFSRAKGVQLVHTEGTGLGLYIAKQMVTKHGGQIGATSPGKDKGSTFYIKFKIDNPKLERLLEKKAEKK